MFNRKIIKKGFTLGEVMVAVFILLFGIVSAMALTTKSINSMVDSRNSIIASLLVQEGVELVRNVRDNNITNQTCGSSGSDRCTAFEDMNSGKCSIDYTLKGDGALNCTDSSKSLLYINEDKYTYTHEQDSNKTSPFKRNVFIVFENATTGNPFNIINDDIDDKVAVVTSVVVWGKGEMPDDANNIKDECKISKKCAFAQTKLTSWINYK
jgi:hypothetical protein